MNIDKIVARQAAYYANDAQLLHSNGNILDLALPKYERYAVCNLRGGIGKSTLTFNIAYDSQNILAIDTCPQGNSTAFFSGATALSGTTIYDALLPYTMPRMPFPSNIAIPIDHYNSYFEKHNSFFVPSSANLYEFPTLLEGALAQARNIPVPREAERARVQILESLKSLIDRELKKLEVSRVIIDTSPFFSGATQLSWHAVDALIVPVRTDQQSVDSLELLLDLLGNPNRAFLRAMGDAGLSIPKIQMVVVTHCGWSTASGARHEPNNQTKIYLKKVKELISKNMNHFTTQDPDNHIVPVDDFLGSGRIASAKQIPIKCLKPNQNFTINGQHVEVNASVEKCQKQLSFISKNIW
ncbi:ParA family protein [Pseudomonas sp. hsmgli-8]|uniref:ParA family protein n=1 Tax=Pseudomonas quercus TaxID=2722792 RepID=A0ABX0YJP9_9PSED|nr:ParA family protein [Pseudomonas quercus]NJP03567.1 ParA family protein [Pseudomonas quercus]